MPKQLINAVGLIVSLGVIALGIALVALPMWVESLAVDTETATVADTNDLYQAQVDALEAEQQRLGEIESSVESLRAEIPATDQFDAVFEVIGRAADAAGVTLVSATAGTPAEFIVRTGPVEPGEGEASEAASATEEETAMAEDDVVAADAGEALPEDVPLSGRQQVDFAIQITANDMAQATRFLDALRAGPRLLDSITATSTQTGTAVEVEVSALAFVDSEG